MYVLRILLIGMLIALSGIKLYAQDEGAWQGEPELVISGFADIFYVYDFNRPQGDRRQDFLFNHNRHNEVNLNLGLVQFNLNHPKYRANLALQAGTYANDNYIEEPGLLKALFEANVGISLNRQNTFWVDAGVFQSPIGWESPISIENMTLTRSLAAENVPYFLTGVKLTYTPNPRWEMSGWMVNGWQRIQRLEGNSLPSFVTQLQFRPSEKTLLNWSTFIGTDDPDASRRMRYFSDLYGEFQWSEKFAMIAGFDFGLQQRTKSSADYDFWFTPVLIGQYSLGPTLKTALRVEYYSDQTGILIPTDAERGFQTTGLSLNLDYEPVHNIMCRLEGRWFSSEDTIFESPSGPTNNNFFIGASLAMRFSRSLGRKPEKVDG